MNKIRILSLELLSPLPDLYYCHLLVLSCFSFHFNPHIVFYKANIYLDSPICLPLIFLLTVPYISGLPSGVIFLHLKAHPLVQEKVYY